MSREININLRVSQEKLELVSGKAIHAACTKGILWRGRQEQSWAKHARKAVRQTWRVF